MNCMEPHFYCDLCTEQATCFCFCRNTKTKLCDACFPRHSSKPPTASHSRFPLTAFKFLEGLVDFELFQKRGDVVAQVVTKLELMEAQVGQDLEQALVHIEEEEKRLVDQVKIRMQSARQLVSDAGKKFEVEIRALKDQVQQAWYMKDLDSSLLAHVLVANPETAVKQVEALRVNIDFRDEVLMDSGYDLFHLNLDSVLGWLSKSMRLEASPTKAAPVRLYTFNPYTPALGIFSPQEQSICLHNINSEFELYDLASWLFLTSGELLIVGGYSEKCTRSVYIVDPYETSIEKLPPMKVSRRRPGLLEFKGNVYVFGGYRDDYLKQSEQLNLDQKSWSNIEDMIIARSGATPVVQQEKAYLAGDGSSLVEEYEFALDAYHLLSFKLPFNSWVTTFCVDNTIYFLQRNVVVTAQRGESGLEKTGLKTLETKNWWYSQSIPILHDHKIFFTRYQEIWTFDPQTCSLAKVSEFS